MTPTAEYRCLKCKTRFEARAKAEPYPKCPTCKGATVRIWEPTPRVWKAGKP